ncbi:hypothetical protein BS47DRAFT_1420884, partial [Hydnum rufescens UP504]
THRSSSQFFQPQISTPPTALPEDRIPHFHLKYKACTNQEYSSNLTSIYLDVLNEIATSSMTFKVKNVLLTGVAKVQSVLRSSMICFPVMLILSSQL